MNAGKQTSSRNVSRRAVLVGLGAGTIALAGCLGDSDGAESTPVRGNADADVTLEVYTDFACPACAAYAQDSMSGILDTYAEPGDIRYEHRDLLIPVEDPGSSQAANAAREVFEEYGSDEFWTYKSRLLARQGEIAGGPDVFGDVADEMGLDGEAIQSAGVDEAHEDDVSADESRAESLGVGGTPGFVVDDEFVASGAGQDAISDVVAALDDALAGN